MEEKESSLRDQILQISRDLLFNDGYQSLSMRKIAGKIGVSATSIYLHFKNKDELIHTLIEESVDDLSAFIENHVNRQSGCIDRFKATVQSYVEFALNNPEKYEIIYIVQPFKMSRFPKEKFRKIRRSYEWLADVLIECVNEGLMILEDPLLAAYSVWAQVHGIVSVVLSQRLDARINKECFINESIELITHGFLLKQQVYK